MGGAGWLWRLSKEHKKGLLRLALGNDEIPKASIANGVGPDSFYSEQDCSPPAIRPRLRYAGGVRRALRRPNHGSRGDDRAQSTIAPTWAVVFLQGPLSRREHSSRGWTMVGCTNICSEIGRDNSPTQPIRSGLDVNVFEGRSTKSAGARFSFKNLLENRLAY